MIVFSRIDVGGCQLRQAVFGKALCPYRSDGTYSQVFRKSARTIPSQVWPRFAVFTPFYFIKAGLFVSVRALWAAVGVIAVLLAIKMVTKVVGVWPLSRYFFMRPREANYTAPLMSTGLTFGTISALFGLQNKIIDRNQYSVLV